MEYKAVKNTSKPGRPPSGCVWVKDVNNNLKTNAKGEVAFRPATAEDLKNKKAAKKKKAAKGPKGRRGRKPAPELVGDMKAALLLKRTYKDLSSGELEKIQSIVSGMIEDAKVAERESIEKEINKLKSKLTNLK